MNFGDMTQADQTAINNYTQQLAATLKTLFQGVAMCRALDAQYQSGSGASQALAKMTASQNSLTNLASTNGNTSAPLVTSATRAFTASDVNNLLVITAGTNWTAGTYQIVGISGSGAILDRACGTAASLSSGSGNVAVMVPNNTNLGGAASFIKHDDIVSMAAHTETMLSNFDTSAVRGLWIESVGPQNSA